MRPGRSGYLLMEAVVVCLILSLSIVALIPIFAMSAKGNRRSERILVSSHLAQELMEEIKLRKWDEAASLRPGPVASPSALGPEPGEDSLDKRTFNDIDDFQGWEEDPPQDPVMRPVADFKGYQRSVSVKYVGGNLSPSSFPTNYKQATICVKYENVIQTCVGRLFANR